MNTQVAYKSGYKYVLEKDLVVQLEEEEFRSPSVITIGTKWGTLGPHGKLVIRAGFACDGPSGFTIDTKTGMRGAIVHDLLYYLMRHGLLDASCREAADRELRRIILLDGMNRFRAWYWYRGVRLGGGFAIDPASSRKVHLAPKLNRAQQKRWKDAERLISLFKDLGMKRITKAIAMIALACSGTMVGLNGCLVQEARDSCVVSFLDGHLTGECVIDIDVPDFDGD